MKKFCIAIAAVCIAIAGLALWRQHLDAAFVTATIGALAWFLSYRIRMKELIAEPDMSATAEGESNHSNEN